MVAYIQTSRNVGAIKIIIYDIKSVLDIFPIVIEAVIPNALVLDAGNYHFDYMGLKDMAHLEIHHMGRGRVSGQVALQDKKSIEIRVGDIRVKAALKAITEAVAVTQQRLVVVLLILG